MRESFEEAVRLLLRLEGKWSNDPRDSGGATNLGVTLATLKCWEKADFDQDGDVDTDDLRALTPEKAMELYREMFWNPMHGDAIPVPFDFLAFDLAVNHGPGGARRILDRSKPDMVDVLAQRKAFYDALVQRRPKDAAFRAGWYNRIARILAYYTDTQEDLNLAMTHIFTPAEVAARDYRGYLGGHSRYVQGA